MNELLLHVRRCRVRGALMRGGVGESEALWLAHWAVSGCWKACYTL